MERYTYHWVNARGKIERVDYVAVDKDGNPYPKYANVYVPFGYDPTQQYPILYLIHGSEGNPDEWLDDCKFKNMMDYSIAEGRCKPMLVVFPTFYTEFDVWGRDRSMEAELQRVNIFCEELPKFIMPAIESKYHTYSPDFTREGFRASRAMRACGGFSLGSATAWQVFTDHSDLFSHFINLSGDCWKIAPLGQALEETCKLLHDTEAETPGTKFFLATGTKDVACKGLCMTVDELKKYPDTFTYSDNYAEGNLHFLLAENAEHEYGAMCSYVYHFLPYLFR